MKAMKHHQATFSKFSENSFFMKMATKFLIPVSIFSIIVSYSSLISFALQSFNLSFSAYSKQIGGYSIDKNYMFLLCNGILVFIFKNSGVINISPEETDLNNAKLAVKQRDNEQQLFVKLSEEKIHMEIEEAQETEQRSCVMVAAENVVSVAQDVQANELMIIEEEEEEEGTGLLSTEELNKKCDDFIRKMKELIKIEAQ